jgi:gliding motility-associated-like protein
VPNVFSIFNESYSNRPGNYVPSPFASISTNDGKLIAYLSYKNDSAFLFNSGGEPISPLDYGDTSEFRGGNVGIFIPVWEDSTINFYYTLRNFGLCKLKIDCRNIDKPKVVGLPILLFSATIGVNISAVKKSDNSGWWIIIPDLLLSKIYILSEKDGLITPHNQIVTNIASGFLGNNYINFGEIREVVRCVFSPLGDRISFAITSYGRLIYDFDRCTGTLTFDTFLPILDDDTNEFYLYGWDMTAFSPDGRFLYATNITTLFQYDLDSPNPTSTRIKLLDLSSYSSPPGQIAFGGCALAPDDKIYISYWVAYTSNRPLNSLGWAAADTTNSYLSVIENPNCLGTCCSLRHKAIALSPAYTFLDLPTMPNYCIAPLWNNTQRNFVPDTVFGCSDLPLQLIPSVQSGFTFEWYDIDGGLLHSGDTLVLERPTEKAYILKVYERVSDCSYALFDTVNVKFAPSCEDVVVEVPNVFSPNSDGINDSWRINVKGDLVEENVKIYNRFGRLLYNGSAIYGWNGANAGEGVYAYHLTYRDNRGRHQRTGMLTLLK